MQKLEEGQKEIKLTTGCDAAVMKTCKRGRDE